MSSTPRLIFLLLLITIRLSAQDTLQNLASDPLNPFFISAFKTRASREISLPASQPLFSIVADSIFYPGCSHPRLVNDTLFFILADSISGWAAPERNFAPGLKYLVHFLNTGKRSHRIENLVPLGEDAGKVYITAAGSREWPQYLCRSRLFRPGYGPIGVVLPDNAWHMGFADYRVSDAFSLTAIARRGLRDKTLTETDRWRVTLKAGGWAEYAIYIDCHAGEWHDGLKMMFRDRWLYDLPSFNNSLFERQDLGWMRNTYIMLLQFAWDKKYYDYAQKRYTWYDHFHEYDSLTGGIDIFTLWPTWPRLGLDQRNQWDMYRDLPGGLAELRHQVDFTHKAGKKYFISFNPWDEGTRKEDHLQGMEDLLRATGADGVVLDTKGESDRELQAAADRVKPGIIMYSEGMAVPKDMPGIVSGRVHDALVLPPPVNLNKFIKPDFAIFRVLQLADDRLHRELAISFFNGYGVEINTMRPGRPDWMAGEFAYLGKTTKILRENNSVFHNDHFFPLIPTLTDSVYVNRWEAGAKVLYTVYSANPAGCRGGLFETAPVGSGHHIVDLWNHREVTPVMRNGKTIIPAVVDSFPRSWLNSRREGSAGCIAILPELLQVQVSDKAFSFACSAGDHIVLTIGDPVYGSKQVSYAASKQPTVNHDILQKNLGKIVIQLFEKSELLDERIILTGKGMARQLPSTGSAGSAETVLPRPLPKLITPAHRTEGASVAPPGMAEIPAGSFRFYTKRDPNTLEPFIPLPNFSDTIRLEMPRFFMDITPVTNAQYKKFIVQSSFKPADTVNYLKHWLNGNPPPGQENMPVVYVSEDDAAAYARWAGKRLPTEQEWQYAAQGNDRRKYPWGDHPDSTRCNANLNFATPVDQYPGGASPFGVMDMTGNVWQLTRDIYDNGCYYFTIIRGGSFYHPTQSIWYVTGGPLPADHPEMLLLMAPGLDRNATVGFRCVKDSN
ncbi:MAG: SUMF1/EgtB/PvdO family nonheme iron enzyme [Bacteroidota bacterium]